MLRELQRNIVFGRIEASCGGGKLKTIVEDGKITTKPIQVGHGRISITSHPANDKARVIVVSEKGASEFNLPPGKETIFSDLDLQISHRED